MLFLKAVVYFVISVQIDTVKSASFLKFYDHVLFDNLALVYEIGLGLAYRFNNFKMNKLRVQASNYQKLDEIISHVKMIVNKKKLIMKANAENARNFVRNTLA